MARFDLSDEEWATIRPHLPKQERGPQRKNDKTVLNNIFIFCAPVRRGAICRNDMARARLFTTATSAGVSAGFGKGYLMCWRRNVRARWSSLISQASRHTERQQAQKRVVGTGYWTLTRRSRQ